MPELASEPLQVAMFWNTYTFPLALVHVHVQHVIEWYSYEALSIRYTVINVM